MLSYVHKAFAAMVLVSSRFRFHYRAWLPTLPCDIIIALQLSGFAISKKIETHYWVKPAFHLLSRFQHDNMTY